MEFVDCTATLGEPGEGGEGTNSIEGVLEEPLCACEQSVYFADLYEANWDEIEIIYFYHPDYLGSTEFVTDMRGEPYQPVRRSLGEGGFFLNTPWGDQALRKSLVGFFSAGASLPRWQENQYAKSYTSFSSRFRFNGKEWDEETGNFYYGARYYDPQISVWLSVDRLAAKYPHVSPYNFSLNNPINLIDPNGDSVIVSGNQSKMLVKELNKRLRNELKIKRDKKSGNLTYESVGDKENISMEAQDMMNAIDDDRINVNIEASQSGINAKGQVAIGSFLGSELSSDGKSVETNQKVVPFILRAFDKASGSPRGQSILHEVLEPYEAGILSLSQQTNAKRGGSIYESAHSCVPPQGFDANSIGAERDPRTGWVHFYINGSTYVETLRK